MTTDELKAFLDQAEAAAKGQAPAQDPQAKEPEKPAEPEKPVEQPELKPTEHEDKTNQAFAEMRVNNKLMEETLRHVADMHGIKDSDLPTVMAKLNDAAVQQRAEASGISAEILKRLDAQDRELQEYRAQKEQNRLTAGFAELQRKYNLGQDELMKFAQQLDTEKVNTAGLNIVSAYESRNMEAIIQARVDAAVKAALAKDAAISGQTSAPLTPGTGSASSDTPNISSTAALLSFFRANGLK